ncbi:pancreatic lipase-related protein 2-like [Ostrea edulis]|uniref:pancreatic lipase-related protein 2-like n=1 Tax=Ostrea edulis TaxID=37623 RepID=UPI0024AEED40|nr:pancreatic lipase-related protein 2-like [Ostrea edulis]
MLFQTFFLSIIWASQAWWLIKREKCYENIGCFDDKAPFDNLSILGKKFLPDSPASVKPRFFLYTRETRNHAEELLPYNSDTVSKSKFDSKRKTIFIIHGFSSFSKDGRLMDMKSAFLSKFDYNVIMVDWSPGANDVMYIKAAANIRVVGAVTANMLKALKDGQSLSYQDVHMIGHSLGAHTCGYVGRRERGIGRITGLDPASPYFEDEDPAVRLDPSDAIFVDVIHTDGRKYFGFGIIQPVGHIDFYPNNGKHQPACHTDTMGALKDLVTGDLESLSEDIACSHMRAILLFTESVRSSCPFTSCCTSCDIKCTRMGLNVNRRVRGRYHLTTNSASPFCQG